MYNHNHSTAYALNFLITFYNLNFNYDYFNNQVFNRKPNELLFENTVTFYFKKSNLYYYKQKKLNNLALEKANEIFFSNLDKTSFIDVWFDI